MPSSITMSASIAFEQSYSGVDGDSASSTEIYALLSSLSGVPLKQNIAVTGSVNQKIEGFFDCCRHKGLNADQGVMIPKSNVKDLMLRKDVVAAVKDGRFTIYAVRNIDEGIEILTGVPAGKLQADGGYPENTINFLVNQKLEKLAEGIKDFPDGQEPERRSGKCRSC